MSAADSLPGAAPTDRERARGWCVRHLPTMYPSFANDVDALVSEFAAVRAEERARVVALADDYCDKMPTHLRESLAGQGASGLRDVIRAVHALFGDAPPSPAPSPDAAPGAAPTDHERRRIARKLIDIAAARDMGVACLDIADYVLACEAAVRAEATAAADARVAALTEALIVARDRAFASLIFAGSVGADEPDSQHENAVDVVSRNGDFIRATDKLDPTNRSHESWELRAADRLAALAADPASVVAPENTAGKSETDAG